jgi:transposase
MEACGSEHYWSRYFQAYCHNVRVIVPQFVKAYVKSPKNDARDVGALCEAVTRLTMRFVPIQRVEQEDFQALHRPDHCHGGSAPGGARLHARALQ